MSLQKLMEEAFPRWQPSAPEVLERSKHFITLSWEQPEMIFLRGELLYRVERREKIPRWVVVYSGGKTSKTIDNLAPCTPHGFRLRVIVKTNAVSHLADKAIEYYGSEDIVREKLKDGILKDVITTCDGEIEDNDITESKEDGDTEVNTLVTEKLNTDVNERGDTKIIQQLHKQRIEEKKPWLESSWSEEVCTSTESDGTSATCFCMAVRGGYLKQVQIMLEERPPLINIINPTTGYTPLGTAIRKGDINMVKFLLSYGAEIEQRSLTGQTPLLLAVLAADITLIDLLLEKGADFQAYDINFLRVEHYAVDSGDLNTLRHVLNRGGDVTVRDNNGWTPLFRAICQGSETCIVDELVSRGSDINITDAAGLTLCSAAKTLTNRHGRPRESILRLVDSQYPHEKALANFTRLTKKISSVHTLFKT